MSGVACTGSRAQAAKVEHALRDGGDTLRVTRSPRLVPHVCGLVESANTDLAPQERRRFPSKAADGGQTC